MSDQRLRDLGVRIEDATPMHDFDDLVSRARRRVARRRAGTLAAVGGLIVAAVFAVAQVGDPARRTSPAPADRIEQGRDPWCLKDRSPDCFDIDGWIVYQHRGIWALDPSRPDAPDQEIQLTDRRQVDPLEWSSDGTKLLVRSWGQYGQLSVLHADGTDTLIANGDFFDGSFSPDGSQVIYASYGSGGIYTVDSDGGTPQLLLAPASSTYPGEKNKMLGELYNPAFSPDGTQIAYFDGMGDWGHSLRVMRSDGTDIRALYEGPGATHIDDLDWSPDGRRLMFAFQQGEGGIWTIGVDGSGLTQVVRNGVRPAWSPDGTQISYQVSRFGGLRIVDADGTHVTEFDFGGSGAWNPLPLD